MAACRKATVSDVAYESEFGAIFQCGFAGSATLLKSEARPAVPIESEPSAVGSAVIRAINSSSLRSSIAAGASGPFGAAAAVSGPAGGTAGGDAIPAAGSVRSPKATRILAADSIGVRRSTFSDRQPQVKQNHAVEGIRPDPW